MNRDLTAPELAMSAESRESSIPLAPLTYSQAGVDIAAADGLVGEISKLLESQDPHILLPGRREYASLARLDLRQLQKPLLATTCDGVGTKLLIAQELRQFRGLGQDLVAMNVNDLLPVGAFPFIFLDYLALAKLDSLACRELIAGMHAACRVCDCFLGGGETAEMPDLYRPGEFDLAGFAVGLADEAMLPQPTEVVVGDKVLALLASGLHANGFSLARKALLERGGLTLTTPMASLATKYALPALNVYGAESLGTVLLTPTALYVPALKQFKQAGYVFKTAAHITGGGLLGRAERLLVSKEQRLVFSPGILEVVPPIYKLIQQLGQIATLEMYRTFNMGLGFLIIVTPEVAEEVQQQNSAWLEVGVVTAGNGGVEIPTVTSP